MGYSKKLYNILGGLQVVIIAESTNNSIPKINEINKVYCRFLSIIHNQTQKCLICAKYCTFLSFFTRLLHEQRISLAIFCAKRGLRLCSLFLSALVRLLHGVFFIQLEFTLLHFKATRCFLLNKKETTKLVAPVFMQRALRTLRVQSSLFQVKALHNHEVRFHALK